jgi:hypothetical protein
MERVWRWVTIYEWRILGTDRKRPFSTHWRQGKLFTITRSDVPLKRRFAFINFPDEESLYTAFIWGRKKGH